MNYLSIDCETTGIDIHSGARPFLVTMCRVKEEPFYWEAPVDPLTRIPLWTREQLLEIRKEIYEAEWVVGQNIKFDYSSLYLLYRDHYIPFQIPWHKTYCTLIAGHLLCSNQRHDLTSMGIQYLGEDISKYEKHLKEIVTKARLRAKKDYPSWSLASKENPLTPSIKSSGWAFDMWVPAAYAAENNYSDNHPWRSVCSDYANQDSLTTLYLWMEMEDHLNSRGLWKIFVERMKLSRISMELEIPRYKKEIRGITINGDRVEQQVKEYMAKSRQLGQECIDIAYSLDYVLELPKTGNNRSLIEFCFGQEHLALPLLDKHKLSAKTGNPSLDKGTLEAYETILPPRSKQLAFVKSLRKKRKVDTAVTYLNGYKRYWQPMRKWGGGFDGASVENLSGFFVLHGSANPTGTDTLRWSFSNPNSANISKQEDFNLRFAFGPAPGREWYSMDGQNLELRIPTYESNEPDLVWIFDHPNDPPYFGSYHLVVFDLLHPEKFKEYGKACKVKYESTLYQWIKNGNFAVIYGCQECKADATYHVEGAYKKIRHRFPRIAALADKQIALANKYGYVQTIPDKLVDPTKGYPLCCTRTEYGRVLPTVPLNYHVSGTAMQWTSTAQILCHNQIEEWQEEDNFDMFIVLQVHDELDFDCIIITRDNLWRIARLKQLMESCGDRIGVPTPVSVERHISTWGEGVDITKELNELALAI